MSIIDKILQFFGKKKPKEKPVQSKRPKLAIVTKHLYTSKMINSITLSSDMKTLYLIDNGRAIDFPIDSEVGILIGKIGNQLSVATAVSPIDQNDNSDDTKVSSRSAGNRVVKIPADAKKSQWTMSFHVDTSQIVIIGTTDIDLSLTTADDVNCGQHIVDLAHKYINIRRKADELELIIIDK